MEFSPLTYTGIGNRILQIMAKVIVDAPIRNIVTGIGQTPLSEHESQRYAWGRKINDTLGELFEEYSGFQPESDEIQTSLDKVTRKYREKYGRKLSSDSAKTLGMNLAGEAFEQAAFRKLLEGESETGRGVVLLPPKGVEKLMNVMYPDVPIEYDDFGKRKFPGLYIPDYIALQKGKDNCLKIVTYYDATMSEADVRHSIDPQKRLLSVKSEFPGFFADTPRFVMVLPRTSVIAGLIGRHTNEYGTPTEYRGVDVDPSWAHEQAIQALQRTYVSLERNDIVSRENRLVLEQLGRSGNGKRLDELFGIIEQRGSGRRHH